MLIRKSIMTIYKSKIGMEVIVPIIIFIGAVTVLMVINSLWSLFIFLFILFVFIIIFFFNISYTIIDNKELRIRHSFFFERLIDINKITKIVETNNPISSPAASLDRIEIKYKSGAVIISPKKKSVFINHLLEINPSIEVKLKSNSVVKLSH